MTANSYPGPETIGRHMLDNGITVLVYENPASATIALEGILRVGSLLEPDDKAGMADFTADMLNRGTQAYSFENVSETLESLGAELYFGSSRHTTGFSAYCLAEDLDVVLDLLTETLCRPVFPVDQIEKLRGQTITGLEMLANDTRRMAYRTFQELAYAGHPYRRSVSGYLETIPNISRDDLLAFHGRHYGPQGLIITLAGAVKREDALRRIDRALGGWRNDHQITTGPVPAAARPMGLQRRHVPMPDKHQADIVIGLPGPPRSAPDYLDASLMNTILGVFGMMGRIGQSVREEKGLAYYAGSRLAGGLGPGPWSASAGVAPDKVELAIESIRHEIRRIIDDPVSPEELADSQAYRTGSLPMSLETNGGIADILTDMELYSLGLDYLQNYTQFINDITIDRIQDAARKYLSADDLAIAVSGPVEAL